MEFAFTQALRLLGPNASFRLINEARPPASYLWATFLPEMNHPSYSVKRGDITVRSTMAGMSGMGSPYPETALVNVSTFLENSAKITNRVTLGEEPLRALQQQMLYLGLNGGSTNEAMVQEVLNFQNALITQPHLDVAEWLRGQALATGQINWTFNNMSLVVDYGIPAGNKLTARTGTASYAGTASTFWADIRAAKKLLKYNVRAFVAHPEMVDAILYNDANKLEVVAQGDNTVQVVRITGTTERRATDQRDSLTLISYGLEGEVIDPANPNTTIKVPFLPKNKIVALGNNSGTVYRVGAGSRTPNDYELGYTHIAPTVEGNGRPGRWSRVYTPEGRPWELVGEGVANELPVIEAPEKIAILTSDLT